MEHSTGAVNSWTVTSQCSVGTDSAVVYTMMAKFQDVTDIVNLVDGFILLTLTYGGSQMGTRPYQGLARGTFIIIIL